MKTAIHITGGLFYLLLGVVLGMVLSWQLISNAIDQDVQQHKIELEGQP